MKILDADLSRWEEEEEDGKGGANMLHKSSARIIPKRGGSGHPCPQIFWLERLKVESSDKDHKEKSVTVA